MCGRYVITEKTIRMIEEALGVTFGEIASRYNLAPGADVPAVRLLKDGYALDLLKWGLVPSWSKEAKLKFSTFNARVESVTQKPAFCVPFRERRCLIPADGFYEWKTEAGKKNPWYFSGAEGEGFAFAGLWDWWKGDEGEINSCTILVGPPNELLAPVHDRMPVILPKSAFEEWLDPKATSPRLMKLLAPYPAGLMTGWPVSKAVGSASLDGPTLIEPLKENPGKRQFDLI